MPGPAYKVGKGADAVKIGALRGCIGATVTRQPSAVLKLFDTAGAVQAVEARSAAVVELALGAAEQFEAAALQLSVAGGTVHREPFDVLFDAVADALSILSSDSDGVRTVERSTAVASDVARGTVCGF
jgi:hypothetical protein